MAEAREATAKLRWENAEADRRRGRKQGDPAGEMTSNQAITSWD